MCGCRFVLLLLTSTIFVEGDEGNLVENLKMKEMMQSMMKSELANINVELSDELEDRVAKLEELARIGTLRTCNEYSHYGVKSSGLFNVDPDGGLTGQKPFQVFCNFASGATEVMHNTESLTEVDHCRDPGCYQKIISYIDGQTQEAVALTQIESLIELSEYCEQSIRYDCTMAPLTDNDVNYAYWEGRKGEQNIYFTGSNDGYHVCDCHYQEGGCTDEKLEQNTCHCDANVPTQLTDTGTITNSTALPVMKLFFGGLNYDLQSAAFQLGRLKCYGEKQVEIGTSCSALKKKGIMKSGYYNIKPTGELRPSLVFCDMTTNTYTDVPQIEELSDVSPIGTILAWVPIPQVGSNTVDLQDGWVLCDGSEITKGPWEGGKTPDLNSIGAFMRGGIIGQALEMEDDQVENHHHDDSGHQHSCSASSSTSSHHHTYSNAVHSSSCAAASNCFCSYSSGPCNIPGSIGHTTTYTSSVTPTTSTNCQTEAKESGLGGVSSPAKKGAETRPVNMKVVYVIRCW